MATGSPVEWHVAINASSSHYRDFAQHIEKGLPIMASGDVEIARAWRGGKPQRKATHPGKEFNATPTPATTDPLRREFSRLGISGHRCSNVKPQPFHRLPSIGICDGKKGGDTSRSAKMNGGSATTHPGPPAPFPIRMHIGHEVTAPNAATSQNFRDGDLSTWHRTMFDWVWEIGSYSPRGGDNRDHLETKGFSFRQCHTRDPFHQLGVVNGTTCRAC